MKLHRKPFTENRTVKDRGKRSKSQNEVKPVENISKNTKSFLGRSPVQQEGPPSHKMQERTCQ